MNLYTIFIFIILGGYILGSIPFGLILTRWAGLGDIRNIGSGNIGATNVLRTGRKDLTILTILFDASKAAVAAIIAYYAVPRTDFMFFGTYTNFSTAAGLIAGTAAIIGHNFPVWIGFKGGKGVASSFGFIVVTAPIVGLLALLTWLFVAFTTRYSSLSAITTALLVPVFTFFYSDYIHLYFFTFISLLLIIRHHANIRRLIKGEEGKIKLKK